MIPGLLWKSDSFSIRPTASPDLGRLFLVHWRPFGPLPRPQHCHNYRAVLALRCGWKEAYKSTVNVTTSRHWQHFRSTSFKYFLNWMFLSKYWIPISYIIFNITICKEVITSNKGYNNTTQNNNVCQHYLLKCFGIENLCCSAYLNVNFTLHDDNKVTVRINN